jgi:hypothetical protein
MDLSYLAGFFDGEGNVTICNQAATGRQLPRLSLRVTVAQTDLAIIVEFKRCFGGNIQPYKRRSVKHSPTWAWVGAHNIGAACLEALLPYLRGKKRDAEIGIAFQNMTRSAGRKWARVTPEARMEREALRLQLITRHGLASRAAG